MRWLLSLIVAFALHNALNAAIVEVTPKATAVLNMDFSPLDPQPSLDGPIVELPARAEPYLIQVDVSMRISDLQPGESGFANTAFNGSALGDGEVLSIEELGILRWLPDNPTVDRPGSGVGFTYLWDINADDGPNKNDLQAVILASATKGFFGPAGVDPRRTLGQEPGGVVAGTTFVLLPGSLGAWTDLEITTPWGASTYDQNGTAVTSGCTAVGGSTATFVVVPEPSCAMLLWVALPLLALKFRR